MGVRLVEVQPDRLAADLHGIGISSLRQQHPAQRSVGLARLRIDPDRGAVRGLGFDVPMLLGQNLSEVAVRPRIVRPEGDGLAK